MSAAAIRDDGWPRRRLVHGLGGDGLPQSGSSAMCTTDSRGARLWHGGPAVDAGNEGCAVSR